MAIKNEMLTAPTRKRGFGALLTINIIFEVQFFVEGLVVKIPAWRVAAERCASCLGDSVYKLSKVTVK